MNIQLHFTGVIEKEIEFYLEFLNKSVLSIFKESKLHFTWFYFKCLQEMFCVKFIEKTKKILAYYNIVINSF